MKTILFTGARSGIMCKVINRIINDYNIYVTVHTVPELNQIKRKYKDNSNIHCLKIDVNNKKDLQKISKIDIDILVSNAAIGESGSVADLKISKIKNNFQTNVFSNFELIQIVLQSMIKKRKGKIIVMSSLAAIIPIPFLGSYCATKAAITKLTEALNIEMKILNKNIKICLIEPGLYNTGFNRLMIDKKYDYMEYRSYFKKQINLIQKYEDSILSILEKNNLTSIVNVIEKSIRNEKPKFRYKAPILQVIGAKIYQIFT